VSYPPARVGGRTWLVRFAKRDEYVHEEHAFLTFDCLPSSGGDGLEDDLAEIVRSLYIDVDEVRSLGEMAADGLEGLADAALIAELVETMTRASIPEKGQAGVPASLDVTRSELAEVLAMELAVSQFKTLVPAPRVAHKEIPQLASRGMDLIGFEESDTLRLVVGETKASDEDASPPGVVEGQKTSLREQLLSSIADTDRLLSELSWCLKHSAEDHHSMIIRAALMLVVSSLEFVVFPVLVRSEAVNRPGDCGSFRETPQDFAPAAVRFCVIRLPGPVDEIAGSVYSRAREVA
jgi:hypothetical protein